MTDLCFGVPNTERSETIVWSNYLINSPAVYSLLEKRVLYYLTLQIKHRFVEKGLDAPEAWKDLYFYLTDKDLGVIGGKTHILQTYEALSDIGSKFMSVSYYNKAKQLICSKVHWIDAFSYNTATKQYEVRMSPEIMPYLINLAKGFTKFCAQTALFLRSKYSQKFYEFCCEFSGNFRYPRSNPNNLSFKKNVYPIQIERLRNLLGLSETRNDRTGKVITKEKYTNFSNLRKKAILPAQEELYELFHNGRSQVWFDCVPFQRKGRKITSVLLFIYSKDNPKEGLQRLWTEADEPLNPFESFTDISLLQPKSHSFQGQSPDSTTSLLQIISTKLSTYLTEPEVSFYLDFLKKEGIADYDSYSQILQVISDKERQPKFISGTKNYKRNSIMLYALHENLKEFGWCLPLPPKLARIKSL